MHSTRRHFARKATVALAAAASLSLLAACSGTSGGGGDQNGDQNGGDSSLVEQAKKEGEVTAALGGHTQDQAKDLADAFEKKYGIKVTFVREASGKIAQKVQAQSSSGKIQFDVVSLNDEGTLASWGEDGLLATPDIPNRDDIIGSLGSKSASAYVPFAWQPLGFVYNEAKTKDAPTTWKELTEAGGVTAVASPAASGAALTFFTAMASEQPELVDELSTGKTLTTDSALALTQLVATGDADFGVPASEPSVLDAKKAGEPLAMGYPEGKLVALPGYMASFEKCDHPAAGKLLVQFALSEEYQAHQAEQQTRSVLSTVSAPEGIIEIPESRMVVVPSEKVSASHDEVVAAFTKALG